jgi:hypothetical protein
MLNSSVRRTSMVKFTGKLVAFFTLFMVVSEFFNMANERIIYYKSNLYRSGLQFEQYKQDTSILIIGDSHPKTAVDPRLLPGSFNMSTQGENMMYTYYRLKYYLEVEKLDIRLAIMEVDVHTFAPVPIDQFILPVFWRKYVDYVEVGKSSKMMGKFLTYRLSGEFSYVNGVNDSIKLLKKSIKGRTNLSQIVQGHLVRTTDYSKEKDPVSIAREKAEFHIQGPVHFDPLVSDYFIRILFLLQKHGVDAILVRYPVAREYYRIVDSKMDIAGYYDSLYELLAQNQLQLPILDYHNIYWDKPDYFANSDHLNQTGAEAFTMLLKNDLEDLGLLP